MSAEPPTSLTNDLRSSAQDSKRDAARKHKWALGAVAAPSRAPGGHPRPNRPNETEFNQKRHTAKSAAVAALAASNKLTRKHDALEGTALGSSDDSAADTNSDEYDGGSPSPPADVGVMYSFDAPKGPSQGSQILNVALAKAVQTFEEKETVKLVKAEYDVLDAEGESVAVTPARARKAKGKKAEAATPAMLPRDVEDEEYEFV